MDDEIFSAAFDSIYITCHLLEKIKQIEEKLIFETTFLA